MKRSKSLKLTLKKSKAKFKLPNLGKRKKKFRLKLPKLPKLPKIPWKTGLFTILLGTDLLAKQYIEDNMKEGQEKEYLNGILRIRKVHNKGFMLNTLDDKPEIVRNVSAGIAAVLAVYNTWFMNTKGHLIKKLGMIFLNAGAASNISDRLFRGKVVDYIGIQTGNEKLSKITANLADLYVFIGAVITSVFR